MVRGFKLLTVILLLGCQKQEDMTLLNFMMTGGIKFDDTVEFNVDNIIDDGPEFHLLGNFLQNPINGNILQIYMAEPGGGTAWTNNRKVAAKISTNNGATFGSQFNIYVPGDGGVNDPAAGYDSTGKLHIFASVMDAANGSQTLDELRYFTSTDDGQTISSIDVIAYPSDGLGGGWMEGIVLENNGVLFKNFYRANGALSLSANYLLRSTDGGDNWSTIIVRATGSNYINEADIIALSDSDLLCTLRTHDPSFGWGHYISDDNGLTWSFDGLTTFGETLGGVARPPSLRKFNIKSQAVIAFYSTNFDADRDFVIYANPADLLASGTSAWNENTKVILLEDGQLGHNNEVHFNNTLEGIYINYKVTGSSSDTYYMTLPTTQYQNIITELGL